MSRKKTDHSSFFDYDVDLERRLIYMGSHADEDGDEAGIDFRLCENMLKGLLALDTLAPDGDKPITILMNNVGGSVYHGLAIYDAILSCHNEVRIMVYGQAFSMAAIILQAADTRIMAPHARLMIHYGTDGSYGHPKDVQSWVEEGKKLDAEVESILLGRMQERDPKLTRKGLQKMMLFDKILSAEESVKLGLVDEVLSVKRGGGRG